MNKVNFISIIILGLLFSAEPVTDESSHSYDSSGRVGAPFTGRLVREARGG